jgi:hypothetical protein
MTRRIDDFVAIRNGELLFLSKDIYDELEVTFYGITETPSIDSPFYCLFSNDIETLRFHLVKCARMHGIVINGCNRGCLVTTAITRDSAFLESTME